MQQVTTDLITSARTRVLPLTQSADRDNTLIAELKQHSPDELFPKARNAEVAYSALLLLCGDWEGSHDLSDDDESPEGCYLHAIIHRIEPNPANSSYWFRQMGKHALFSAVRECARQILVRRPVVGWQLKSEWDPYLLNAWCEQAREAPGSEKEKTALALQRAEWDLLFKWCAETIA